MEPPATSTRFQTRSSVSGWRSALPQEHSNWDNQNTLNTTPRVVGRLQDNHPNCSAHASVKCSLLDHGWAQQHTSNKQFRKGEGCETVGWCRVCFCPAGRQWSICSAHTFQHPVSPHAAAWCVYIVLHPVADSLLGSLQCFTSRLGTTYIEKTLNSHQMRPEVVSPQLALIKHSFLTAAEGADRVILKTNWDSGLCLLYLCQENITSQGFKNQGVQQVIQKSVSVEGTFRKIMGQHKLWACV